MPIKKCKNGYKWGNKGKCYPSKKSAIKQAIAIAFSYKKRKKQIPVEYKKFMKERYGRYS